MSSSGNVKKAHEIIRAAMKERGLDFTAMAALIDEPRVDKLSVAVRCSSGTGQRAIEIRRKIARALDLEPENVWDKVYLEQRKVERTGYKKAKFARDIKPAEWATLSPAERVRALAAERDLSLVHLAEHFGLPYKNFTNHIYGTLTNHEVRLAVADFFKIHPSKIWDKKYAAPEKSATVPLEDQITANPELEVWLGFGDLTKTYKSKS